MTKNKFMNTMLGMKKRRFIGLIVCFWAVFGLISTSYAQTLTIKFPKRKIAKNEQFQVVLEIKDGNARRMSGFPDFEGFQKTGTSSGSNMQIVNGQMSYTYSITQNYSPIKEGVFRIAPFTIQVDNQRVTSQEVTVEVGPAIQKQQRRYYDPFAFDPFGDPFGFYSQEEPSYVDIKADAFLALSTDKSSVYVGEGVHLVLAFYESASNKALLDFHNLQEQLTAMVNKLKPSNCWEENFQIMEIKRESIELQGKPYFRYKLFETVYYPLVAKDLVFPKLDMEFVNYKQAQRISFFQPSMKKGFKTFSTEPKRVKVKPLPPHPLKDQVSVGQFALEEKLNDTLTTPGKGLSYSFKVKGSGNISSISEPILQDLPSIQVYPPAVYQELQRSNGKVLGQKTFEYFIVPEAQGDIKLNELVYWVYFDPKRAVYDTLLPKKIISVGKGETEAGVLSFIKDPFYRQIGQFDNSLSSIHRKNSLVHWLFGILVLSLTIGITYSWIKKSTRS